MKHSDTIQLDQTSELLDGFTKDFKLNYTTIEGNEVTVTAQAKGQMAAINKQLNAKSLSTLSHLIVYENYPMLMQLRLLQEYLVYLFKGKVEKGIRLW